MYYYFKYGNNKDFYDLSIREYYYIILLDPVSSEVFCREPGLSKLESLFVRSISIAQLNKLLRG